ncbi:MAG: CHAT domain-containing protein [Candidatus Binatus sp.]|uniref:CHAT domain-containing protein n=1 Tax=Candidatus Binatus sp. TaxID=2811406 RepID=UPI00271F9439|nr:CHAT domain-containing protein [Candidatus Binatus sp.]MDO8434767.1 CHAT domain-containing protein [Candidatus Binatus sp.]
MTAKTSVVNWAGDYEETCIQLGKHLGKNKIRRMLFGAIYGRGSKPRSKKQLMAEVGLKASHAQQAQNQLDHLWRYGLIERNENEGAVADGSCYVYSKEPNVGAHRKKIVQHADKPALAKKTPTKRNPMVRGMTVVVKPVVRRSTLKKNKHLDVLYLMANPIRKHSLRVDAEVRKVCEEIRRSQYRDNITLHQSPAADLTTIIRGLNDHRPGIVHFSGHGNADGLATDDGGVKRTKTQFVTFDLLGKALAATDDPPKVVVLNACRSAGARGALFGTAKAIIAMQDSIGDAAAVAFATMFYGGIASGQSLQSAFEQGCVAVESVSLREAATPKLITANGVDAKKLKLA